MGGAIVLMLHRKDPTYWDGAILVAPMCKVIFDNLCTHCHLIFLSIIACIYIRAHLSLIMMKLIFQWDNIHIDCRRYEAPSHHDFNFK